MAESSFNARSPFTSHITQASVTALKIIKITENVNHNKEVFNVIGEKVGSLMEVVLSRIDEKDPNNATEISLFYTRVKELPGFLEKIKRQIKKHANRPKYIRAFFLIAGKSVLVDCSDQLRKAENRFRADYIVDKLTIKENKVFTTEVKPSQSTPSVNIIPTISAVPPSPSINAVPVPSRNVSPAPSNELILPPSTNITRPPSMRGSFGAGSSQSSQLVQTPPEAADIFALMQRAKTQFIIGNGTATIINEGKSHSITGNGNTYYA